MFKAISNVHPIRDDVENASIESQSQEEAKVNTRRDMSIVSLFVSLLVVILLGVFYFGLSQSMNGLSVEMQEVRAMSQAMPTLTARVDSLEGKLAVLDALPERTRRLIVYGMLGEMSQKGEYLSGQLGDTEEAQKLRDAVAIIRQVEEKLAGQQ